MISPIQANTQPLQFGCCGNNTPQTASRFGGQLADLRASALATAQADLQAARVRLSGGQRLNILA